MWNNAYKNKIPWCWKTERDFHFMPWNIYFFKFIFCFPIILFLTNWITNEFFVLLCHTFTYQFLFLIKKKTVWNGNIASIFLYMWYTFLYSMFFYSLSHFHILYLPSYVCWKENVNKMIHCKSVKVPCHFPLEWRVYLKYLLHKA